jgi:hypothetical protein
MKRSRLVWLAILTCVGIQGVRYVAARRPSQAKMVARFHAGRSDFERLRAMMAQDKKLRFVTFNSFGGEGDDFGTPAQKLQHLGVSQPRIDEYRAVMARLGITFIQRRHNLKEYLRMNIHSGGFTDTSWSNGYAWSRFTPTNVHPWDHHSPLVHTPIEGQWYLYRSE